MLRTVDDLNAIAGACLPTVLFLGCSAADEARDRVGAAFKNRAARRQEQPAPRPPLRARREA